MRKFAYKNKFSLFFGKSRLCFLVTMHIIMEADRRIGLPWKRA